MAALWLEGITTEFADDRLETAGAGSIASLSDVLNGYLNYVDIGAGSKIRDVLLGSGRNRRLVISARP